MSIIEESTRIAIQEIATEEQSATLPHYEGESALADYHYLQLLRAPLTFDQLAHAQYVNSEDKSCVKYNTSAPKIWLWATALSNNILRAGKHYATFDVQSSSQRGVMVLVGVMRPGQVNQNASGTPVDKNFYQNFSRYPVERFNNNNNIQSCIYLSATGDCFTSDWKRTSGTTADIINWDGKESITTAPNNIGMLLDLDEGTLSVYKNGLKLGVMKRGLAGPYCWVASLDNQGAQITIKRGAIPSN